MLAYSGSLDEASILCVILLGPLSAAAANELLASFNLFKFLIAVLIFSTQFFISLSVSADR